MADYFVLLLLVGTSLVGVAAGLTWRLPLRGLSAALGKTLEAIGLAMLFCAVNLFVGAALVLLLRAITGRFVSLYYAADVVLLVCSALLALFFQRWWEARKRLRT